jgi:hypothetical protein
MEAKFFFKALLFGAAVLSTTGAFAQKESVNADTIKVDQQVSNQLKGEVHYDFVGTPKEAYNFLKDNPADTLVTSPIAVISDSTVNVQGQPMTVFAGDTLYVHLKYNLDGPRAIHRDTLWVLNAHEEEIIPVMSNLERKVARLAKETAVLDKVNSGRERDRNGYRVTFDNGHEYTITSKAQNKYGWQIGVYAGGEFGGVTGVTAGGRLGYTHKWLSGTIDAGLGYNKYEENAEENLAGTGMVTFDSRAMGWFNLMPLFKTDTYNQWRLELGGGAGFKGFKTKSREVTNPDGSIDLVQSEGNGFYWTGGLKGTYQPSNKEYSFSLEGGVSQTPNVWQDQGQQNHLTYYVRLAVNFDCWRHKVNNRK